MKLSVFVVTYNQERYIGQAIESILMQKVNFEYEVIVGEDCSTDDTPAICDQYAEKYPFIHIFHHKKNLGLVKNWEFVINHCSGEYVAMLEGDDFWNDPEKLQRQVDFLDKHPEFSLCFTGVNVIYNANALDENLFANLEEREYSRGEAYKDWNILSSSIVYRNNIVPIRYPEQVTVTDDYTFLKIMQHGKPYCLSNKMVSYRRHESNITRTMDASSYISAVRQYQHMKYEFPKYWFITSYKQDICLRKFIWGPYFKGIGRYRLLYITHHPKKIFSKYFVAACLPALFPAPLN